MMKRVLITGAGSYIGDSVKQYLLQKPEEYDILVKDTIDWIPKKADFRNIDVVFNVAGIAHIKETKQNRQRYFDINRDLVVRIAKTAKAAGVKQFVLLSTMSVYGVVTGHITKNTPEKPINAYGLSKVQADHRIKRLEDENFRFACLRPPMVYGKGCKGNYQSLRKLALKCPCFPGYNNKRSMVFIGNLCEFVKKIIDDGSSGLFFPQNDEYVNTKEMVRMIAKINNKNIKFTSIFNLGIKMLPVEKVKKAFGNLTYDHVDTIDKYGFEESMYLTEK